MSKKIVLFLSSLRSGAEASEYLCPDGNRVSGVQTNEEPVLYLLRKHADIAEILCICDAGIAAVRMGEIQHGCCRLPQRTAGRTDWRFARRRRSRAGARISTSPPHA